MTEITSIPTELIKIFANAGNLPRRYDDVIALELLKYLQKLARSEKLATPSLDLYLAGKYPAMDTSSISYATGWIPRSSKDRMSVR